MSILNDSDESRQTTAKGTPKTVKSHRSLIRGVEPDPSGPVLVGKIKDIDIAPDLPTVSLDELGPDAASLSPAELEKELANQRTNAKAQLEDELQQYRTEFLANAEAEKKAMLDKGYQEGLVKGKEEGSAEFKRKVAEYFESLNHIEQQKAQYFKNSEKDLLELACEISKTIITKELSLNKQACLAVVEDTIQKITDKDNVIIRVHPSEAEQVRQHLPSLKDLMPDIKNLTVDSDDRVAIGGCIVETKLGFIDASLSTKLDSIRKAIFKAYDDAQ